MINGKGEEPKNDLSFLDRVDWDKMRDEVAKKVTMLGLADKAASQNPAIRDTMRRDLILPNLRLIMEFCEAIKEDEE